MRCGLAFIIALDVIVSQHPLQSIASPASFERPLLNIRLDHDVVIANIYRPPVQNQDRPWVLMAPRPTWDDATWMASNSTWYSD